MKLFNKEKDLILRIVNLIFLVWFIVAITLCYNGAVNLIMKERTLSYSEYKEDKCNISDCTSNSNTCTIKPEQSQDETNCKSMYISYKTDLDSANTGYKKQIISSILTSLTVAGAIYLLNKNNKQKKDNYLSFLLSTIEFYN